MSLTASQQDQSGKTVWRTVLMAFIIIILYAAFPARGHAETQRTWHFTGADLIAALEGRMPPQVQEPSLHRLFSSTYGQAYIVGIADQTQDSLWCTHTGVLPHELSDRVYVYLSGLPDISLRENAGPLVGEALSRTFPCQHGGSFVPP